MLKMIWTIRTKQIALVFLCLTAWGMSGVLAQDAVPVAPTPAQETTGHDGLPIDRSMPVTVRFLSPEPDAILPNNTIDIFVDVTNYALASDGNRLHVFIDNESPQDWSDIQTPLTFKDLSEGGHFLQVVAVRPDGTMLSNPEAYAAVHFFVRHRDFQNYIDLNEPYLTVNLPLSSSGPSAESGRRVWFDFIAHNVHLAKEKGYVVRCTVNQQAQILTEKHPIYWDTLQPGRYELTAELLTSTLLPAPGIFNQVHRTFEVQAPVKAMPVQPLTVPGWTPTPVTVPDSHPEATD